MGTESPHAAARQQTGEITVGAHREVALVAKNLVEELARIAATPGEARDEMLRETLSTARELFSALSEEDPVKLEGALAKVDTACHETALFAEVGRMTRSLHSSLIQFRSEVQPKLQHAVGTAVPEVNDKLQAVVRMTDEAAHRVLQLTEEQSKVLAEQRRSVEELTAKVFAGETPADEREWLALAGKVTQTVLSSCSRAEQLNTEILMAQEFQDLTGQLIKKVTKLVTDVEDGLVQLIRIFGQDLAPNVSAEPTPVETPVEPEKSDAGSCSQDDVNDLLASFGF